MTTFTGLLCIYTLIGSTLGTMVIGWYIFFANEPLYKTRWVRWVAYVLFFNAILWLWPVIVFKIWRAINI